MNTLANPVPVDTTQLDQIHLFKSRMSSCNYIFKNGKIAQFIRGEYTTNVAYEVAELEYEVSLGHPQIFINDQERVVAVDRNDPIAALRRKIIAEERERIMAEVRAATALDRDMGTSEQGKFKPASTSDIAPLTAEGDGSARLQNLKSAVAQVVRAGQA
jgi:hypothetical protein